MTTKISRPVSLAAPLLMALSVSACVGGNDATGPGAGVATAPGQAGANAGRPGWTGSTFVPGSSSTVASDATATRQQQTGSYGRQR